MPDLILRSTSELIGPYVRKGPIIRSSDLASAVQLARQNRGVKRFQAARELGVSPRELEKAESSVHAAFRLRKRMMEKFVGVTLDGPYYRIVPVSGNEG